MSARRMVLALLPVVLAAGCAQTAAMGRYNAVAQGPTQRVRAKAAAGAAVDQASPPMPTATGLVTTASRAAAATAGNGLGPAIGPEAAASARKLIRDAALVIGVNNQAEAIREAQSVASGFGGYTQEAVRNRVILRVPAARFDEAVTRLGKLGIVSDRKIEARDVTDAYADLALRLQAKRATVERLKALLERGQKMEELLKIEKELERLTEEIERLEAAQRLMGSRVAMSTISVEFIELVRAAQITWRPELPFPWLHSLGLDVLVD